LSFKHIESSFTFELLDDVLHDNLELKASTYHYHKKLQQMTSPLFPASVAVSEEFRLSGCQLNHVRVEPISGALSGFTAMETPQEYEVGWFPVWREGGSWV